MYDSDSDSSEETERRTRFVLGVVAAVVPMLLDDVEIPVPRNNSAHTAKMRLQELMDSHHAGRFLDAMRMNKPTFVSLCAVLKQQTGIKDKRETTVEENVLLFIRHGLCGESNRGTQENRQRSASTISSALNETADFILFIEDYFIRGPSSQHQGPRPGIVGNPKFIRRSIRSSD